MKSQGDQVHRKEDVQSETGRHVEFGELIRGKGREYAYRTHVESIRMVRRHVKFGWERSSFRDRSSSSVEGKDRGGMVPPRVVCSCVALFCSYLFASGDALGQLHARLIYASQK